MDDSGTRARLTDAPDGRELAAVLFGLRNLSRADSDDALTPQEIERALRALAGEDISARAASAGGQTRRCSSSPAGTIGLRRPSLRAPTRAPARSTTRRQHHRHRDHHHEVVHNTDGECASPSAALPFPAKLDAALSPSIFRLDQKNPLAAAVPPCRIASVFGRSGEERAASQSDDFGTLATCATIVDRENPDAARKFASRFFAVARPSVVTVGEA